MNMDQHVTVLSILYIGCGALFLCGAGIVFVAVVGGGLLSGEPDAIWITSGVGTAIACFLAALGAPGILGGIGLLKRAEWARILVLVLGFLNLINFPLGTLLGIYTIWALMRDEATEYFRTYARA